jgi:hypothetical protein
MREAGKPNANVKVMTDPHVGGYAQVAAMLRDGNTAIIEKYGHYDFWLFLPDSDLCSESAASDIEIIVERNLRANGKSTRFFCCPIIPESEILCSVSRFKQLSVRWDEARLLTQGFKEQVFEPLVKSLGYENNATMGRDILAIEAASNMSMFFNLIPEMKNLRDKIAASS